MNVNEIILLEKEGESAETIAEMLGIEVSEVKRVIRQHTNSTGYKHKSLRWINDADVIEHYNNGLSYNEIGELMGRSYNAIYGKVMSLLRRGVISERPAPPQPRPIKQARQFLSFQHRRKAIEQHFKEGKSLEWMLEHLDYSSDYIKAVYSQTKAKTIIYRK